jgi:hypothetical protein
MEIIVDILQLIGFLVVAPIIILFSIDILTTIAVTVSHFKYKGIMNDIQFTVEDGIYPILLPNKDTKTQIRFICKIPNPFDDVGIIGSVLYHTMNIVSLYKYQIILKNNIRIRVPIWSKTHSDINRILKSNSL